MYFGISGDIHLSTRKKKMGVKRKQIHLDKKIYKTFVVAHNLCDSNDTLYGKFFLKKANTFSSQIHAISIYKYKEKRN